MTERERAFTPDEISALCSKRTNRVADITARDAQAGDSGTGIGLPALAFVTGLAALVG